MLDLLHRKKFFSILFCQLYKPRFPRILLQRKEVFVRDICTAVEQGPNPRRKRIKSSMLWRTGLSEQAELGDVRVRSESAERPRTPTDVCAKNCESTSNFVIFILEKHG